MVKLTVAVVTGCVLLCPNISNAAAKRCVLILNASFFDTEVLQCTRKMARSVHPQYCCLGCNRRSYCGEAICVGCNGTTRCC